MTLESRWKVTVVTVVDAPQVATEVATGLFIERPVMCDGRLVPMFLVQNAAYNYATGPGGLDVWFDQKAVVQFCRIVMEKVRMDGVVDVPAEWADFATSRSVT